MIFTGILANLDGQPDCFGDIVEPTCEVEIADDVKVTHEFEQKVDSWLGTANLTREPNAIRYEIDIKVEKFPEEMLKLLSPCMGGSILERDGRKITKMIINSIGLCIEGNADSRVKPLGEQK